MSNIVQESRSVRSSHIPLCQITSCVFVSPNVNQTFTQAQSINPSRVDTIKCCETHSQLAPVYMQMRLNNSVSKFTIPPCIKGGESVRHYHSACDLRAFLTRRISKHLQHSPVQCGVNLCATQNCVYNNRHRRRSVADDISFQQSVESGRPTGGYMFYKYYFRNFVNTIRVLSDSKRPPMMNARRKSVHSGKLIGSGQVSNELHLLLWTVNSPHNCLFNVN